MENETCQISRKEQERLARIIDIQDIAARLFSEKGFHEVRVDDIAEEVGLSKGTIYLYFENKEKLFYSIITDRATRLMNQLLDTVEQKISFKERLHGFVRTYLDFLNENSAFFRIIHSEKARMSMESHHELHEWAEKAYIASLAMQEAIVRAGKNEGVVRNVNEKDAARMLAGMLDATATQRIIMGDSAPVEDDVRTIIDLFLNGVKAH